MMNVLKKSLATMMVASVAVFGAGCADSFEIRDVDPGQAGVVRSLGPESQDVKRVADEMVRSLLELPKLKNAEKPPTIVMLPLTNNTRFAFNTDIVTNVFETELMKRGGGELVFVDREIMRDIESERDAKRDGVVDYDPEKRTNTIAGVDYFLKGELAGLSSASKKGQAEYMHFNFRLVDAESSIKLWQDGWDVKKEGKDDVVYR